MSAEVLKFGENGASEGVYGFNKIERETGCGKWMHRDVIVKYISRYAMSRQFEAAKRK